MTSYNIDSALNLEESIIPNLCLGQFLLNRLNEHNSKELLLDCPSGRVWLGRDIAAKATRLAAAFINEFDFKTGDTVLFYAPNSDYFAISMIAVFISGGIYTGITDNCTLRELRNAVNDIDANYIICSKYNYKTAVKIVTEFNCVKKLFVIDDGVNVDLEADGEDLLKWFNYENKVNDLKFPVLRQASDIVAYSMSSGTTGKPKPAIKTNANLIHLAYVLSDEDLFGHKSNDITMSTLFVHISGMITLLQCINEGTKVAVMREKLDLINFCEFVQTYGITSAFVVPTFLYMLADQCIVEKYDLSSLRDIIYIGSNISLSKLDLIKKLLPNIRHVLRPSYGLTEIGCVTQALKSKLKSTPFLSVGTPIPGILIRIIDRDSGKLLNACETGEVCIKSAHVSPAYYKMPEITSQLFGKDGYFKSGDAGYLDEENNLYIVYRYKEIIKVCGSQVSLVELEDILREHEGVDEVAVISLPDEIKGEIPKAFIVLKEGYNHIDDRAIMSYLSERVIPIKQLFGGVQFVPYLPKLSFGKVDKMALLEKYN